VNDGGYSIEFQTRRTLLQWDSYYCYLKNRFVLIVVIDKTNLY